MHNNHKIIKIDDEKTIKKENITIEDSSKDLNINIQKLSNLKDSLVHEIKKIDEEYIKIDKETTKSYEIKMEKLKKEEDGLKEKLKNNVTKIKEQLELSITEVNNLLRISDKLVKGIKSIEKEEKIMIKTLSYISVINKIKKDMNKLFRKLMKNLKMSFIEEQSTIKYEEYYFNGIPLPKNIEFKNVGTNSLNVLWKIDDINIINIDKNEIKYRIEIRKENKNQDFIKVYENKDNYYLVDKLEKNTIYEIKICTIYNDIASEYSEIKKIKTSDIDSIILNQIEKGNEFLQKLYEWSGYHQMSLLYRGTRDGSNADIFHSKCDNQGPTICLCKNEKNNIFGAYSSFPWTEDGKYHKAEGSFIFTLTNMYNTPPAKYPVKQNDNKAVYHQKGNGPCFGGGLDFYITNNFLNCTSYVDLGSSYPDSLGKGNSVFSANLNDKWFQIKELEVFKIFN